MVTCTSPSGSKMAVNPGMRALVAFAAFLALMPACARTSESARDQGRQVLRFVPQSDLQILDPVWTTASVTRNHGYLIYDTLFGMDAEGRIAPQMVEKWDVSKDRKTWTFTLRDGLEFNDGKPVTSDDVIASLQRWSQRDNMGQKLLSFLESWEALDAKTFRINLKIPYGLVVTLRLSPGRAGGFRDVSRSKRLTSIRHSFCNAS